MILGGCDGETECKNHEIVPLLGKEDGRWRRFFCCTIANVMFFVPVWFGVLNIGLRHCREIKSN